MVLVANPRVPANNVRELIAYAKANPGKLNYASIGLGTQQHLGMELFKLMTKTDINQVEYRGTAAAMTDVVAGQCRHHVYRHAVGQRHVGGGKLKLLAVTGKTRSALLPDVPTVEESGVPGFTLKRLVRHPGAGQNAKAQSSTG